MSNLEFYNLLNITSNATKDEINKAYKKMALKCHPDRNLNNKEEAEEEFKKITHAYEILSNEEERKFYDKYGKTRKDYEEENKQNMNMDDILNGMFGGMKGFGGFGGMSGFGGMPQMSRGFINVQPDIVKQIQIELVDIYNGKKVNIQYTKMTINLINNIKKQENLVYNLNLEIGFDPRQKIVLQGLGNDITMVNNNQIKGNLIIELQIVKPKNYNIKGNTLDLYSTQKISLVQSLCGLEMSIKKPNDTKIKIYYDNVIQPNKFYKIKNAGIPYINNLTNKLDYHDLYISFEIIYPDTLDTKSKKAICDAFNYVYNPNLNESILLESSNENNNSDDNDYEQPQFQGVQCAQQ
jgi:curved DNA-binding protein